MKRLMQILALVAIVFVSSTAIVGCDDTFEGAGEDIEEVGDEIDEEI